MIYPKVGLSLEKLNLIALFNFLLENMPPYAWFLVEDGAAMYF